jgi:hypothetical protein
MREPVPKELLDLDLPGLPIDRLVLQMMANARHVTEIQIVDGLPRCRQQGAGRRHDHLGQPSPRTRDRSTGLRSLADN